MFSVGGHRKGKGAMAILCALHPAFGADLLHALQTEMPDESWLLWEPDKVRPGDVEAALIWRMRAGMGLALAGARFISATGAGVDHLREVEGRVGPAARVHVRCAAAIRAACAQRIRVTAAIAATVAAWIMQATR